MGGAVCRAALAAGLKVTSVNRSGAPSDDEWTKEVEWIEGEARLAAIGRAEVALYPPQATSLNPAHGSKVWRVQLASVRRLMSTVATVTIGVVF